MTYLVLVLGLANPKDVTSIIGYVQNAGKIQIGVSKIRNATNIQMYMCMIHDVLGMS